MKLFIYMLKLKSLNTLHGCMLFISHKMKQNYFCNLIKAEFGENRSTICLFLLLILPLQNLHESGNMFS